MGGTSAIRAKMTTANNGWTGMLPPPLPPEQDLLQIVGLLQMITENINAVFWARNLQTDQLLYISSAYEKIWGYSRQALYRRHESWMDAVHPDDLPLVRDRHGRRQVGDEISEYRIIRRDGAIRWVRARIFVICDQQGRACQEVGIAEDITEFRELLDRLRQSENRFRFLVEEEQKRIARDLHDEFGQLLPLLRGRIERLCPVSPGMSDRKDSFKEEKEEIRFLVNKMLDGIGETIRRTINRLRPELLDHLGLLPCIEEKLREFRGCHPGIKTSFTVVGKPFPIPPARDIELYRVVQESLTNTAKHAVCSQVTIRLIFSYPNAILDILDNGHGFNRKAGPGRRVSDRGGFGLIGMRERIEAIGGTMRVRSEVGAGTGIRVELPLASAAGPQPPTQAKLPAATPAEAVAEAHQWSSLVLPPINEAIAGVVGEEFFHTLVHHLARTVEMPFAFVLELDEVDANLGRIIALWTGSGYGESFTCNLRSTPCLEVRRRGGLYVCPEKVTAYHDHYWLREHEIESYLGMPLLDAAGNCLGLIALMDTRPLRQVERKIAVLEKVAGRAVCELERMQVERVIWRDRERLLRQTRQQAAESRSR